MKKTMITLAAAALALTTAASAQSGPSPAQVDAFGTAAAACLKAAGILSVTPGDGLCYPTSRASIYCESSGEGRRPLVEKCNKEGVAAIHGQHQRWSPASAPAR